MKTLFIPTVFVLLASFPAVADLVTLKAGNDRFVAGESKSRRAELVSGQKPKTIVLSCSDSRTPPELVFDQGLGELFTIRVAGNVLGAAQVASIEYAIEHLGSKELVIMGHESCGAVKAALTAARGKSAGSPDLDSLIASVRGNLEDSAGRALASPAAPSADETKFRAEVIANVNAVAKSLVKRSRIVRHAMEESGFKILPAIYSLESGKVEFLESPASERASH
jgi:carbonic anhydrase